MPKLTVRSIIVLLVLLGFTATPVLGYQTKALFAGTGSGHGSAESLFDSFPFRLADQPPDPDGLQRLMADTDGMAIVSFNRATGKASFIRLPQAAPLPSTLSQAAPVTAAASGFLSRYGSAFGIKNPKTELRYEGSYTDASGMTHLTYQQVYGGVEVFAGVLKVHFDGNNRITAVNGTFVPKVHIRAVPDLSADDAGWIAIDTVAGQSALRSPFHDLNVANSRLYVYQAGLASGVAGTVHLVYEVEVTNTLLTVREFVYVDAHTGIVVDQISGIHESLDREISETSLANVIWDESIGDPNPLPAGWAGGTAQQVTDWQNEVDGAGETYNLFASMAGWDSYNNLGATMRTVNNDPAISCPNANWNGTSTNYCSNVTGDDTVAHEWGHAYTDFTSNLIYQWQSGALNESYSDIWGEVVDFVNGRGTDSPGGPRTDGSCSVFGSGTPSVDNSYRWLSGEDDPAFGGAIRDLWNPTCYNDPGKVTDTQYWCTAGDGGGVHTNSGVPNHAFALMVDGGTYNGQTITGLGLTKAAHIHWRAQSIYLGPASNFTDQADALEASCSDLIGVNLNALSTSSATPVPSGEIITAADCTEVSEVMAAVEFRTEPTQCNFTTLLDPNAPALCEGVGTVEPIASENWEGGSLPAGWTVDTHDVANPATFDTPNWDVVGSLPAGTGGSYAAFVPDLIIGDCAADDESGALFLDSPVIAIPTTAEVPRVAFDHWVATELGWDGGNLKVSVNGGPWTLVPASAYDFNPYNLSLNSAGNTNPLAGEGAFSGTDGGSVGGSWGQSQVNLIGLAFPGDNVQFRFDFGVDGCNGVVGWYVDDVQVYSCSDEIGPICGDAVLDAGESCDDGNTANGDGCSAVCQIEGGWTCQDPIPPTSGTNVVNDGSFEAGPFGGIWNEFSTNFGTPICDVGSCGTGTGTGPSDGSFWTWFGGIAAYELGIVNQNVTIPATATDLTFDLEQIVCDSANDYAALFVDANLEWFTLGSSPLCGTLGYTPQTVDLSAYADGGVHQMQFQSEIFATNGGGTNFFLDDVFLSDNVEIPGSPSVCMPIIEDLVCNGGTVAFDGGIPSSWVVVDNAGLGMVWTNIAGSGESGNYTGGSGDAATASSDAFGPADFDTELRSNVFSLANATSASLDYLANYQNFAAFDFLDLDISTDGGATWTNLLSWNEDHGGFRGTLGEAVNIDLSPYLGGANVQLRWRYYDPTTFDWDWYAQVDNASLTCNLAPDCSAATASIDTLWPPNHKFNSIEILNVSDPDGDPVTITIDSIFQDERVRGPGKNHPDGRGVGTSTAEVRAERDGKGNGRVYHISFTAQDGQGGMCSSKVLVGVPHDQGDGGPIDDGPLYDSTVP